jgi:hypothetical protein
MLRNSGWAYWTQHYETALTIPTGPVNVSASFGNTYSRYDPQNCPVPEGRSP